MIAGLAPPAEADDAGLRVRDLVKQVMDAQDARLFAGRITKDTWRDYDLACDELVNGLGAARAVADLRPSDFSRLVRFWGSRWSLGRIDKFIVLTRTIMNFAMENGLLDKNPLYGSEFKQLTARERRMMRAKAGERMFEREEILTMVRLAPQPLLSMILLAVNAGMGNKDCATLPESAVDLKRGWIKFPRPKTGEERRFPLWPVTIAALREWLPQRPIPNDEALRENVFLTPTGRLWVSASTTHNPLSKAMAAFMAEVGIKSGKPSRGFYTFRHVFETIGGESRDQVAVNAIMGHADSSMAAQYRERISDERLQAVVNFVRAWLYTEPKEKMERPRLRIAVEEDHSIQEKAAIA